MKGWTMAGSHPADYEYKPTGETVDNNVVVRLRAVNDTADGFGTMMQVIAPTKYLGTRVRLSGSLKGNDIDGWAGLWLRVDGQRGAPSAFDNMQDRPVRGSTDWSRAEVVLDVDEHATAIAFGVLLSGTGSVDISSLRFEEVDSGVPVTGVPQVTEPVNLDFADE
ncbi:hypothetical protein [Mycolicibacterium mageritense]|uniref:DUF1349 domain-containing protein n=1 Tax=Mycolicibacterium mageritense TaxID=53462 RepID=A0ABM7HRP6_MYCME|nr:hypothetical protein [Mycolicibacterium mageritense]MCC9184541.1 hypothetical protein [Mycolicibacterium mageritense]BBX33217.1 hypothetical protein MMAGJ_24990 [Mycolicibacterium mageritense]GJJ22418.1 hypothetical protein MTY414_60910 [Mycolicibacterium mageritense]CDO21650.1 hypothetical protein BN978_02114 [Mycolicibacterium mageritense DSM 44476 = CIP 104973]